MKTTTSFVFKNTEYRLHNPNDLVEREEAKRQCKNDGMKLAVVENKDQVKMLSKFIKVNLPHNYYQYFHVDSSERMINKNSSDQSRSLSPRMGAKSSHLAQEIGLLPSSQSLEYLNNDVDISNDANFICMRSLENFDLQNDNYQTPLPLVDRSENLITQTNPEMRTSSRSFVERHIPLMCLGSGIILGLLFSIVIFVIKTYRRRQKRQNF